MLLLLTQFANTDSHNTQIARKLLIPLSQMQRIGFGRANVKFTRYRFCSEVWFALKKSTNVHWLSLKCSFYRYQYDICIFYFRQVTIHECHPRFPERNRGDQAWMILSARTRGGFSRVRVPSTNLCEYDGNAWHTLLHFLFVLFSVGAEVGCT